MSNTAQKGHVHLVGAGPGDAELLTLKGARMIQAADVVVHDRLVSPDVLAMISKKVPRFDVGKMPRHHPVPQDQINELLIELAGKYRNVVRLKGGDPYIFGRGSEEAEALRKAGIGITVTPGITAAQGVAASTGVPLTHRGLSTGVRLVTGHCQANRPLDLDWDGLADPDTTLVVYMGHANIEQISSELICHGLPKEHPVMVVANGTRPNETRMFTQLQALAGRETAFAPPGPVLFIIGRVVTLMQQGEETLIEGLLSEPDIRKVLHG